MGGSGSHYFMYNDKKKTKLTKILMMEWMELSFCLKVSRNCYLQPTAGSCKGNYALLHHTCDIV